MMYRCFLNYAFAARATLNLLKSYASGRVDEITGLSKCSLTISVMFSFKNSSFMKGFCYG